MSWRGKDVRRTSADSNLNSYLVHSMTQNKSLRPLRLTFCIRKMGIVVPPPMSHEG